MGDKSDLESEVEPFSGGSSDNYEPSSPEGEMSDTDSDNNGVNIPKKRKIRNEKKWKRNIRKRLLAEGKKHMNSRNKLRPLRTTGNDCHCKYKCFEKVPDETRALILNKFNELGDKFQQDIYLTGLITQKPVNLNRSSGSRKKCSNIYMVRSVGLLLSK